MLKIVFRCDASIQMGSGHVMRCLTLANALREKGAEITFVCREHPGHLFEQIEASSHKLLRLPASTSSSGGALAHALWLGTTQEQDARQTTEALKSMGHIDWLIVDHYALDIEWETAMRASTKRIMVIDDLADRVHDCDMLLDQNYYRDIEGRYKKLTPPHCRKLLGPKYALLRPEFREAYSKLKVRDGNIKRIFIFFGGGDPTNETGKTLQAIQHLGQTDIAVDVVIGSANPHYEKIANLCAGLLKTKLHRQVNNIADLMASADLAIGAAGSATWERCLLGLPTIILILADNQREAAKDMADTGAIVSLGEASNVSVEQISETIKHFISHPNECKVLSSLAMKIVPMPLESVADNILEELAC